MSIDPAPLPTTMPMPIAVAHSEDGVLSLNRSPTCSADTKGPVSFADVKKKPRYPSACALSRRKRKTSKDVSVSESTEVCSQSSDSEPEEDEEEQMGDPATEEEKTELAAATATEVPGSASSDSDSLTWGATMALQPVLVVDVEKTTRPLPEVQTPVIDQTASSTSENSASVGVGAIRTSRRTASIIKFTPLEEIPVKEGRFTWLQLPKPDMSKIKSLSVPCAGMNTNTLTEAQARRRSTGVVFHEVQIRCYEQTIGDNPSVSYGPPISLDWAYEEVEPINLDEYENSRGPRRNTRQMMLNYYNRKNLLTWRFGATEEEMKAAEKEVKKIKSQRSLTKAMLPAQKLEEVIQSIARKTKRLACRSV